jgi:23S rRNA pseudouridine2605 synthase
MGERKEKPKAKGKKASPKPKEKKSSKDIKEKGSPGLVRLNKYIANAGICSRREADVLISSGVIKINGEIVTALGTKVAPTDKIQYGDQSLRTEKNVYVLLNKPKGFITTMDDPQQRKTVMSLVSNACSERIYPVGRLDRNTSGLLLFTNDGDLATRLTHPRHKVHKIYHAVLDKKLTKHDFEKIMMGMELEDGFIRVNNISFVEGVQSKKEVGLDLHSGRNRIVRRIFESLGYNVTKLDRVSFAGLTKKDLPRGKWRYLNEKEVHFLKMI